MTCDIQNRSIGDVLELLIEQGLDGTAEAISILLNEAMRLERERHLGAVARAAAWQFPVCRA